jgi:hypothetical protein
MTDDAAWIKQEAANSTITAGLEVMFLGGAGQPGATDTLPDGVIKRTTNTEEALLFFTSVELMAKVRVGDMRHANMSSIHRVLQPKWV